MFVYDIVPVIQLLLISYYHSKLHTSPPLTRTHTCTSLHTLYFSNIRVIFIVYLLVFHHLVSLDTS